MRRQGVGKLRYLLAPNSYFSPQVQHHCAFILRCEVVAKIPLEADPNGNAEAAAAAAGNASTESDVASADKCVVQ